ncbi:hypothetical protein AVEN_6056-1 [Araneus ventricosus]|uniref:Uncharacterized protein n=1 Tax=Araneus ventricosus TaxID=182803 RepID=A0A4Y2G282_ARAVE|nr:hypothetical protein AVEN_6056-1 [Araneus ventricosus]
MVVENRLRNPRVSGSRPNCTEAHEPGHEYSFRFNVHQLVFNSGIWESLFGVALVVWPRIQITPKCSRTFVFCRIWLTDLRLRRRATVRFRRLATDLDYAAVHTCRFRHLATDLDYAAVHTCRFRHPATDLDYAAVHTCRFRPLAINPNYTYLHIQSVRVKSPPTYVEQWSRAGCVVLLIWAPDQNYEA